MAAPTKASDIDLAPIPGKRYLSLTREWREEFIYFLMMDRFHDDQARAPVVTGRPESAASPRRTISSAARSRASLTTSITSRGSAAPPSGSRRSSRTMPRRTTATTSTTTSSVDPRFGTEQDLIDLVEAAHNFKKTAQPFPMRIILDVVINHSGDNWDYPGGTERLFRTISSFAFGGLAPRRPADPDRTAQRGLVPPPWQHHRLRLPRPENQHGRHRRPEGLRQRRRRRSARR